MITKIIQEELIQKAKKYIERGERFVIVTHVSPDGDALGSSLGLCHFLFHQFTQRDEPYQIIADMDALTAFSAALSTSVVRI